MKGTLKISLLIFGAGLLIGFYLWQRHPQPILHEDVNVSTHAPLTQNTPPTGPSSQPSPSPWISPSPPMKLPSPEETLSPRLQLKVTSDPYQDDTVIAMTETKPDPDGNFTRTKVVRSKDFKYPLIRIKEGLVKNFSSGEEHLQARTAMISDHVIVTLEPEYSEPDLVRVLKNLGSYQIRKTGRSSHYFLVTFEGTSVDAVDKAIQELKRSKIITSVEPDFIVTAN